MKAITLLFALMLSIISAAAITSVYESTSVSRIVGNTPDEMMMQFDRGDLNLKHASYYGSSQGVAGQNKQLLAQTFGSELTYNPTNLWIENTGQKLMVFDSPNANDAPDQNVITTSDVAAWSNELDSQHSLIAMNAQYAGLSLPRTNGFGTKTPPHAAFIAPTAYKSQILLKTLLCNIGAVSGLGKTVRQARNNYHWNIGETLWGSNELVGLTLISYSLYGNPFARVNVPNFDTFYRTSYCKGLMEDFETQSATQYRIADTGTEYKKTVTFTLSSNAVETADNFEIISTPETDEQYIPGELVLPARVVTSEFPLKTLITDVKAITFSDPVEIDANVPMWDGTQHVERHCAQSTSAPGIDFSHGYSENSEAVLARVNPMEIVDCEQGKFKLYKTTTYEITYYPYSPVRITGVELENDVLPGTIQTATVHLENTQSSPATGQLALTDSAGAVVSIKDISTTQSTHTLELPVPENEGTYTYNAEFIQDGQSKTRYEFSIDVQILEAELLISGGGSSAEITIIVNSNWQTPIASDIIVQLSHDGNPFAEKTQAATIQPGDNEFTMSFAGLTKEDEAYDVLAIIPYQGHDLTISSKIITNHAPAILNGQIIAKEGENILVDLNVIDSDGDALVTEISEQPFPLDGAHTLDYDESGEYSFTITTTDGISAVEMTIPIIVENVNRAPEITVPDFVQGKEGQELTASAVASDLDNENNAENDDNALTITYGPPFGANGKYTANFDEQREIITFVKVSDGELETTKLITLQIENTNRAPTLDQLADITVKESEPVDLWKSSDPDNENEVANDDNTLQMYFAGGPDGGPIDHFGRWQTDFDDSGVYPITVQVEDGELKAGKLITLTVQNVNRAPVITAPDVVYASGSVDLSQYVTDPDNTNNVATDDNTLAVTYTSPFDSNGKWMPAQPDSAAQVTITVSDGEFTVTKTIMVMVDVVGVQPVQNPPVPDEETQATPETSQQETQQTVQATQTPQPTIQQTQTETSNQAASAPEPTPTQPATQANVQILNAQQTVQESKQEGQLEVMVTVDGKEVDDGDSVKVRPDDAFKVKVELMNNAAIEKKVDVDVELGDFDQDDGDSVMLKPGENERFTFEFEVPRLTDDDEYPLEIIVNEEIWEITLKIDKPSHEITIRSLTIEPEKVLCEQTTAKLDVKIENTGRDDEEGTIKIESSTLKLLDEWQFDLPEGESQRFERTINALVPGSHNIIVKALYGSRIAQSERQLIVQACVQEETVNTQIAPEERIALALSNKQTAVPVSTDAGVGETLTIVFMALTGTFAILLLAVVLPPLFKN